MNYEFDLTEDEAREAKRVLEPRGYRILVALPKVKEKQGSIIIPEARRDDEDAAAVMGTVLTVGPDAYKDAKKFPSGPWCQEGDVVMIGAYSGRRIKIDEREYRLINDDTVQALIKDYDKVTRA